MLTQNKKELPPKKKLNQNHNNLAMLRKTTYYLKTEEYFELDKSPQKCLIFRI